MLILGSICVYSYRMNWNAYKYPQDRNVLEFVETASVIRDLVGENNRVFVVLQAREHWSPFLIVGDHSPDALNLMSMPEEVRSKLLQNSKYPLIENKLSRYARQYPTWSNGRTTRKILVHQRGLVELPTSNAED